MKYVTTGRGIVCVWYRAMRVCHIVSCTADCLVPQLNLPSSLRLPPPSCVFFFRLLASPPPPERKDLAVLVPMGFLHALSHLTVVLGLGAGAVSFLQTVKAAEVCFTALLSYLFLGQVRESQRNERGRTNRKMAAWDPSRSRVARAANPWFCFCSFGEECS